MYTWNNTRTWYMLRSKRKKRIPRKKKEIFQEISQSKSKKKKKKKSNIPRNFPIERGTKTKEISAGRDDKKRRIRYRHTRARGVRAIKAAWPAQCGSLFPERRYAALMNEPGGPPVSQCGKNGEDIS